MSTALRLSARTERQSGLNYPLIVLNVVVGDRQMNLRILGSG